MRASACARVAHSRVRAGQHASTLAVEQVLATVAALLSHSARGVVSNAALFLAYLTKQGACARVRSPATLTRGGEVQTARTPLC